MKRIWKYVRKVEKHLPLSQRVSVGGSIYAELRERAKARASELGRDLTDAEIDALTQAYGDPRLVAERRVTCDPGRRPLVDRYLAAVGRHLSQDKAHDILAEMREAIESRIDAREEETGGELDDEAVAAELKAFGPPMVAASRYAERDRLIGPDLYPFFWPAAKAVLGLLAAVALLLAFVSAISSRNWGRFAPQAIDMFLDAFLPAFAVMTLIFMLLDRTDAGKKIAARWDPRSLPHDHIRKPRTMFESILGLGFDLLFVLWWSQAVDFSGFGRDGSIIINWDGSWAQYHTVILVLAGCSAAAHAYDIFHPGWSRLRSAASIGGHIVGVYVAAQLAREPALLVGGPGAGEVSAEAGKLLGSLNTSMQMALGVVAVIMALGVIVEGWRMVRSLTEGAARGRASAEVG